MDSALNFDKVERWGRGKHEKKPMLVVNCWLYLITFNFASKNSAGKDGISLIISLENKKVKSGKFYSEAPEGI